MPTFWHHSNDSSSHNTNQQFTGQSLSRIATFSGIKEQDEDKEEDKKQGHQEHDADEEEEGDTAPVLLITPY